MLLAVPTKAQAEVKTPSATFGYLASNTRVTSVKERHIKILQKYLEDHDSTMSTSARTFVEEAEANDLDWRFVASISGVESYFGKHIPYNSYNGWGWGVYGTNVIRFSSWDEAITTISQTLKTRYIDRGATDVPSIGRMYAADPNWSSKVQHFMTDIAKYESTFTDTKLSISI
jgi:hypothetical protein